MGVGRYMEAASNAQNPFLQGKSIHNQRIERLWKDYFEKRIRAFYLRTNRSRVNQLERGAYTDKLKLLWHSTVKAINVNFKSGSTS